jgi:segregation and condensation protein B
MATFGLASLRDLPDLERLEDEGLLPRPSSDGDPDGALKLVRDDDGSESDEDGTDYDDGDGHRSTDW